MTIGVLRTAQQPIPGKFSTEGFACWRIFVLVPPISNSEPSCTETVGNVAVCPDHWWNTTRLACGSPTQRVSSLRPFVLTFTFVRTYCAWFGTSLRTGANYALYLIFSKKRRDDGAFSETPCTSCESISAALSGARPQSSSCSDRLSKIARNTGALPRDDQKKDSPFHRQRAHPDIAAEEAPGTKGTDSCRSFSRR
jgi:hypothetical protein